MYGFYLVAACAWLAWAAAQFRRSAASPRAVRAAAIASFFLTLTGLTWMVATNAFYASWPLYIASGALPVAFLVAAWQSAAVARAGQKQAWVVALFNTVVGGVLALRCVAYLGADTGLFGESLSLAYATIQTVAFLPALWLPIYVHLPILAPGVAPTHGPPRVAWGVAVIFAGASMVFLLFALPGSVRTIASWRAKAAEFEREARSASAPASRSVIRSAKVLETIRRPRADRFFDLELARLDSLRLDAATLVVSADAFLVGEAALAPVDRFVEKNLASGRRLLLWVQGHSAWYRDGWPAPDAVVGELGVLQRAAAERWRPDWFVICGDPLQANALLGPGGDERRASRVLEELADSVKAGAPNSLVVLAGLEPFPSVTGAETDSLAAERETLFRWAASDLSPIDRVGLSLSPGFADTETFWRQLAATSRLLESVGQSKRVWVVEYAACPVTVGESTDRALGSWITDWAGGENALEGMSRSALGDYAETVGEYSVLGRLRR